MNKLEYIELLKEILGNECVKENEDMSKHSSIRVGGKADIFVTINSMEKLEKVLKLDYDIPVTVIGNGSNILVKDSGIRGLVIKYSASNYTIEKKQDCYEVTAEAGLSNGKMAYALVKEEIITI